MNTLDHHILTLVTFAPLVGALLLILLPRRDRDIRIFSLVVSLLTFVLSLHLPVYFKRPLYLGGGFHYEIDKPWISTPNIHYHMGMDGISLWLVVLTTFLTPLCVLISWHSVHDRVKEFFILLLIMETALIGVFTLLDLFLFYFFWEATLDSDGAADWSLWARAQGVCGGEILHVHDDRLSVYAGGDPRLYAHTGSFEFTEIRHQIARGAVPNFPAAAQWLFLAFSWLSAVKVSAVSVPYVVARRARGSANGWICAAGRSATRRWEPTGCCASTSACSPSNRAITLRGS